MSYRDKSVAVEGRESRHEREMNLGVASQLHRKGTCNILVMTMWKGRQCGQKKKYLAYHTNTNRSLQMTICSVGLIDMTIVGILLSSHKFQEGPCT